MKKNIISLVSRSLLTLLLTFDLAAADDTPQLQKVRHTVLSPSTEQVVLQLNGSYSPKVFTLKDETPRVIFDFANMTHGLEVKSITPTNGSIVKRVRVGRHTDDSPKTRVVFDVATLQGVTYTQKFDEKTSSLVIQFTGPEKVATQRKPQTQLTEKATEKTTETQPAAVVEPPQAPSEAAPIDTIVPPQPPTQQSEPPNILAEPTKQEPLAGTEQQPAPAVEAAAPAKPESKKTVEKEAPAPQKKAAEITAEKKAAEKPLTPPPIEAKPEASVDAKPPEKAETLQSAGDAKPAEAVKETAAGPATGKKGELKKAETAAKEPPRPEAAVEPQAPAKTETAPADSKNKTETAKPAVPAKSAEGPQLEYVKFDATSSKGEMVMFKLNGFHPPTVHGVEEGIPRVICDFNNTKLIDSTKNLIKTDGKFVKVIRTSKTKKPEKVRVVIDLEPNRSYDLQQVFFKEDNLFVIIVNTVKK